MHGREREIERERDLGLDLLDVVQAQPVKPTPKLNSPAVPIANLRLSGALGWLNALFLLSLSWLPLPLPLLLLLLPPSLSFGGLWLFAGGAFEDEDEEEAA